MTLRKHAISGVRWTTFSALGRAILQFAQVAILARLLGPSDFGLIALVVATLAFLQIFADAGLSNAIIHHQEISEDQLSSLYWLNVASGTVLAILLVIVSGWAAAWYEQPQLKFLLWLASGVLVAGAVSQQLRIVAQKNLKFSPLAKIELTGAMIGFFVAVCTAYAGAGVYSLMLGTLSAAISGSSLVWWRLAEGWRPKWGLRISEIRHFLNFGAYMLGNNIANTFNSQVDVLLGSKLLGAQAVGLYTVPKDLNLRIATVINPIVTQVGTPIMARAQDDKLLLKRVYLQTLRMTASLNFPIYVAVAAFAPEIVHLLLGSQWVSSIPLVQIFSLWGLLRSISNPVGSLLIAQGKAALSFKWNTAWLCVIPPILWLGSHGGVEGMAIAMAVIGALGYWPNWYFLVRPLCGAELGEYSMQLINPLVLSILAGIAGYFIGHAVEEELWRLFIGVTSGMFIYLALSMRFNQAWLNAMIELITGYSQKSRGIHNTAVAGQMDSETRQ